MVDKTTTLKTQTGDNVYPNVLDKNIPNSIVRGVELNAVEENLNNKIAELANGMKGEIDSKQNIFYSHFIIISSDTDLNVNFNYYSTQETEYTADTLITALAGKYVTCSGYVVDDNDYNMALNVTSSNGQLVFSSFLPSDGSTTSISFSSLDISDSVTAVE